MGLQHPNLPLGSALSFRGRTEGQRDLSKATREWGTGGNRRCGGLKAVLRAVRRKPMIGVYTQG